jgi:hypothetical protein
LSDVIFFLESFGPIDNVFAIFNGLSSRMDKNEHLLVLFQIIEGHFVASFVKNVSDVFLFRKVVCGIFWVFDSDEMNEQGNGPVVGIKVEESIFAVNFQEVSDIVVIGKSCTETNKPDVFLGSFFGSEESGNDGFDNPASLIVEKMDLVENDQVYVLKDSGTFSGSNVPLFRGGD